MQRLEKTKARIDSTVRFQQRGRAQKVDGKARRVLQGNSKEKCGDGIPASLASFEKELERRCRHGT